MYPLFHLPAVGELLAAVAYTKREVMNQPKPTTRTFTLTTEDIRGFIGQPAANLADLLLKYPDVFALHIEALRDGILTGYSQHEQAQLLKSLDNVSRIHIVQSLPIAEVLPVEGQIQIAVPDSVNFVSGPEPVIDSTIRADVELIRMAVALGMSREAQLWCIVRQAVRESGKNYLLKSDLPGLLKRYGVKCDERTLRRWRADAHDHHFLINGRDRVRLIGYDDVSKSLTRAARAAEMPDLISTNRPGQRRDMYIDVASSSLIEWEANVYAAWLASRNNPTIARSTLARLFNRDSSVLRQWEEIAGITIVQNWGHYVSEFSDHVPQGESGELREDVHEYVIDGGTRWKAQLPNTYVVSTFIRQHPKRGQSRRVARDVLKILESDNPTGDYGQDDSGAAAVVGGLEPLRRMYFEDSPKATASDKARRAAARKGVNSDRWLGVGQPKCGEFQHVYAPDGIQRVTARQCLPKYTPGAYHV